MRLLIFTSVVLLCACAAQPSSPDPRGAQATDSSRAASSVRSPLLQVPPDLSIDAFATMTLVGSGLTLKQMEKNFAYTRYAADYWSNGLRISGIMNIPAGEGPFPLLMLNHGYIHPSVYTRGRGLKREQDYLARQGFAVFHSDYRGHGDSDESPDNTRKAYDAGLEYAMDVVNAIDAVKRADLQTVDASRIGMLGHSMGGGVSMNIAVAYPELIDALVLYAPVNSDAWKNYFRWRHERDADDRTIEVLGTREEHPQAWDWLSSKTYLDRWKAPLLLFQGGRDTDVPKAWSDGLADALRSEGKVLTYLEYPAEGHEFARRFGDFMEKTAAFFREHLGSGLP